MTNSRLVSSLAAFLVITAVYAASEDDWDYRDGRLGPKNWTWHCQQAQQSPIDIPYSGAISDLEALGPTLAGSCVSTNFTSDKTGMLWAYTGFNDCTAIGSVASKMFSLIEFHLHHPSEHTINNFTFDGEVHFVHRHSDGRLLAIAVLLEASGTTANSFMAGALERFPALLSEEDLTDVPQPQAVSNARESFIPVSGKWFNYQGSLTTPPCNETVDWWVSGEPVIISTAQLEEIQRVFLLNPRNNGSMNARPTQQLNGREVRPILPTALVATPVPTAPLSPTSAGVRQLFDLGSILALLTSVLFDF